MMNGATKVRKPVSTRKRVYRAVKGEVREKLYETWYMIKKSLIYLPSAVQVCVPVLFVYYGLSLKKTLLFSLLLFMFCNILREVSVAVNCTTYSGLPLPRRRYTVMDRKNKFISLREGYETEAILFLHELEEKLISRGIMKDES